MNLLKRIFKRNSEEQQETVLPKAGEFWSFQDESPFPSPYYPVKIREVRDGWVRYDMESTKDNRNKLDFFLKCYRLTTESDFGYRELPKPQVIQEG